MACAPHHDIWQVIVRLPVGLVTCHQSLSQSEMGSSNQPEILLGLSWAGILLAQHAEKIGHGLRLCRNLDRTAQMAEITAFLSR